MIYLLVYMVVCQGTALWYLRGWYQLLVPIVLGGIVLCLLGKALTWRRK